MTVDKAKEVTVEETDAGRPKSPEKRKASGDNDAEKSGEDLPAPSRSKKTKTTAVAADDDDGRARRERKQVQYYTVEATVKAPKAIVVPEGSGTPLKDIKKVAEKITAIAATDDLIIGFHTLIWGRAGRAKQLKQDLLKFKGFNFRSDKEHDAALEKLARWTNAGLKEFAQTLCLESSGTKEVVIDRIFKFLLAPSTSAIKGSATPRKTPSKSPKLGKALAKKPGPKAKPKSAFDVYAQENREEAVEELDENATEEDLREKLQELFKQLSQEELKEYEEKYEANKAKTPVKVSKPVKESKTPKVEKTPKSAKVKGSKSAETVDESSEVEREDVKDEVASPTADDDAEDDKPLATASTDGTPSNEAIVAAIEEVLKEGKLAELSNKKVRVRLEKVFNRDMSDKKLFINECIDKMLSALQ